MGFGSLALQLLAIGVVWLALARLAPPAWKLRATFALKLYLTGLVFWLILFHEVDGRTIYTTLAVVMGYEAQVGTKHDSLGT